MRIGEFLERQRVQPSGLGYAFQTEQLELRPRDGEAFQRGLQRNGPRAVNEFARAEEIWAERTRVTRAAPRNVAPRWAHSRRRPLSCGGAFGEPLC